LKLGLVDAILNVDKEQDGKKVQKNDTATIFCNILNLHILLSHDQMTGF
jgi:hypothetical protein